jgi:hypothetical protein
MAHARYSPKRHGISGCSIARLEEPDGREIGEPYADDGALEVWPTPPGRDRAGPPPAPWLAPLATLVPTST